ncbi:efflux RND transporter periplasmic adaptor subunit [Sphingobium nicotianae]|uniref:Efflux RND transporter periplasmic adaptor subunit n=1 Tax=Sphingobium nicotianae TaxID=2782607 RepID=A0A9X1DDG3_9SPHN|nr:efflux RND transporter periplasmic adaptor subunit [Sphingobium nicotianae]MBT2187884.1 efflux RND transporter periplasmic adaptor subunit [Sphingobium nicotianae]
MNRNKWLIGGALGLVALALVWWLVPHGGTGDPGDPAPEEKASVAGAPREMSLSAEQAKALSLHFARAEQASLVPIATVPAMVSPPPNARVAVAAQLPGVVMRVFVVEGQDVHAGQMLATVSSRDVVSLAAELARARARLDVARANAARLAQLSKEGIVAPARADEAGALFRQAQIDVSEQARLIGMANGSSGTGYSLTAPIGGRISTMSIETGKALDPGAAPFVIDAGGAMQAQGQLPERLIGKVQPGMTVRAAGASGKVLAVGSAIDPATRSASLTASLDGGGDRDGAVRAGQALSLAIMGPAPQGAVRVPAAAVAQLPGGAIVFVRSARGVIPRPVTLAAGGERSDGERIILSGLKPGEDVVITSVSELKALATAE